MNDNHQSHFEHAYSIYHTRLKSAWHDGVKNSFNKVYASDYYRTILLTENPALPTKTVFFDELRTLFDHLYNLNGTIAVSQIVEQSASIRKKSREALELIERYSDGSADLDFFELPVHYEELLDEGVDSQELIAQEKQVLELTDPQVIELLALYAATQKLQVELYPDKEQSNQTPTIDSNRKDRFTRPRQVLTFHYLLEAGGLNHNAANITDCARLLHKFIGVPEPDDIANSDLYKLLKNPLGKFDHKTIRNLRVILPHFEKLPHYPIMKMINRDLRSCDGDQ